MKMVNRIIASAKVIIAFIYTFTYCQSWGNEEGDKNYQKKKDVFLIK